MIIVGRIVLMKPKMKIKKELLFSPFVGQTKTSQYILPYKDVLLELSTFTCSGFRLPLSFFEKFAIYFLLFFEQCIIFSPVILYGDRVPYTWTIITQYLFRKGVSKNKNFELIPIENGLPSFYKAKLYLQTTSSSTDGQNVDVGGLGVHWDISVSFSKSVGELLERGFLSRYFLKEQYFASLEDMVKVGKKFLHPKELNGFLPFQKNAFPIYLYTEKSSFYWTLCRNLSLGMNVYVPTQIVFWGYDFKKSPNEPRLGYSTTSGCGGYFTEKKAILSGLYEAVQRDAVLIYWLNKITPRKIAIETIPSTKIQEIYTTLRERNIEIHFLYTTSDIAVPTFSCVMVDSSHVEDITISFSSASGFSIVEVLENSLLECFAVRPLHYQEDRYVYNESIYKSFLTTDLNKNGRVQIWRGKDMYDKFSFFISGDTVPYDVFAKEGRYFSNEDEEYSYALNLFKGKGKGYEIYVYTPNNEILSELGYHVARVIVPKLIPLYLYENMATLDAPRIKEVPPLIGYTASEEINTLPHPIP